MGRNVYISPTNFQRIGSNIGRKCHRGNSISDQRYRGLFGVSDVVTSDLWQMVPSTDGGTPKHLLWGLLFLKNYNNEYLHATAVGCDEKTFRKWSKQYVLYLFQIQTVRSRERNLK